ncbi:MAG: hemagglutinin/hemolysin-related protein, partial [Planctomycetaceae bacterium]|nr:hemagglutinin/hemolysin-related protein [Planctomycetaceae bacterium]
TLTNAATTTFTFQFSENMTGFTTGDVTVTNGTKGAFTAVDGDTYTLVVTPTSDGTVGVSVAANSTQDAAGNNIALTTVSVTSDRTAPALTITPNGTATYQAWTYFTFQFSEVVVGFDVSDIVVTNGTKQAFTMTDVNTYTLQVGATFDGVITVTVGAGAAHDAAGNNTALATASITEDRSPPSLVVTPDGITTNAASIPFTFQFNEVVLGFDASGITVENGTKGTFTAVDGDTYILNVSPVADGIVVVYISGTAAHDAAGNNSFVGGTGVISDRTAPALTITPNGGANNASSITYTFQFTETVTGFDATDINLSNGTKGAFTAVDGDTYTLVVTPVAEGPVLVSVSANAAIDAATNGNTAANSSVTSDHTSPVLTITPNGTTTNAALITFTFQFSEIVTGFDTNDVAVSNGTNGAFTAIDGDTYTLIVTPTADGTVTASVESNALQDAAGNTNTVLAAASVTSDRTVPTLIVTPNSGATNSSPILFTFQFSETVTGFTASDITLTNGTKGTFTAVDGDTYTLLVTPVAFGTVTASVAANAVQDTAGNNNGLTAGSVISDRIVPTVAISPNSGTTALSQITFTFQFSETVTGFDVKDITITNAALETFTAVDGETYTLVATPTTDGVLTATVAANAAQDAAGNGNALTTASIISDRTAPALAISPDNIATSANPIVFTFHFTETVSGFTSSDINVTNGTKGAFSAIDGDTYTLQVTPGSNGAVTVSVVADAVQDSAGNSNAVTSASVTSDRMAPSLVITPGSVVTNASQITFTLQFSEPVTGFDSSDILVTNGTKGTFTAVDGDTYTLAVTPVADGIVSLGVNSNAAVDLASNGNTAASASITSDRTAPALSITPNGSLTNAAAITFTFQFGESVTGFDTDDIQVTNGTMAAFALVGNGTYTLVVSPASDGAVSVSVVAGVATDPASNSSTAATATITSDRTLPSPVITPNGTHTNSVPLTLTFQFGENVTGFDATDITVTNGTKGTFTAVDGDTYILVVTPLADGLVVASVVANAVQDAVGNKNLLTTGSVTVDRSAPSLSITPGIGATNADSIVFTFQFSENVMGFDAGDITLTNGTKGSFTAVDGDTYTLVVTPLADGQVAATVAANAAQDASGNNSTAANGTVVSDRTAPALTITPNGTSTNASPILFTFQFAESVTGFDIDDVTVTNGSKGTFSAIDGDTYTLAVTPAANGTVTASVAANAAQDGAGNNNAATIVSVISDRTNPGLTIAPNSGFTNASSISFTFQFSEDVTGFDASDVNLSNGTKGSFIAVDSDTYTLVVTPVADGAVSIAVSANAAVDGDSNGNLAATASVIVDRIAPTLVVAANGALTNAAAIAFTFQFSETVTGFDASDISVTNGTKGAFTALDGDTYSLLVNPVADGSVAVSVAANGAQDSAGNHSTLATTAVMSDRTVPSLAITPSSGVTNAGSMTFTFQFTETVTGFDVNDVNVTNGTKGAFTTVDGDTYSLVINAVADGNISVGVNGNAALDAALNGNTAANAVVTSDRTPPTLVITPNGTPTNAASITFRFQFGESVTGFGASDIIVSNGTPGIFTAVDVDTYTLVVTPTADGTVGVNAAANAAQDSAGNPNAQTSIGVASDRTVPSLLITPNSGVTNASTVTYTFQFSETVTGFDAGDINLTNGTPGAFSALDGDTYTLVVTPTQDGPVVASVSANAAQDVAGNPNSLASGVVNSDRTAPTATISPNSLTTNASPILFTFQFTEQVTGFDASDVNVTNGAKGLFSAVDGDTYTLSVTPVVDGTVSVSVVANAVQDAAGNKNMLTNAAVILDRSTPLLAITPSGGATNASSITFTFQFSEAVTGFVAGDIAVSNGTKVAFAAVDSDTYTLVVTPVAEGAVSVVVNSNAAFDADTNGNIAANASITSDHTGPTLGITPNGTLTNAAAITFTFQFSEAVTGFDVNDVNVSNGSKGAFAVVDGDTYTLVVAPNAAGAMSVGVNANAASDAAANGNSGATASITSDRTAPTLSITPNGSLTTAAAITFTFQFNESMTGFDASDINVTNGTKGTFTAVDGDTYTLIVTPNSDGQVSASVNSNRTSDAAGNGNTATSASVTSDRSGPAFSSSASPAILENETILPAVSATDAHGPVTFAIQGGPDASLFLLDPNTGALQFLAPPDFETPTDSDADNVYQLQIRSIDGLGLISFQDMAVTVAPVNEYSPFFTSANSYQVVEHLTTVGNIAATDADLPAQVITYSITGGSDAAKFNITATGTLTFVTAPDFDHPADLGGDNTYNVTITATDNSIPTHSTSQVLVIAVTNINETPSNISLSAATVSEQQPVGTAIGDFSATDADTGGTFSYSLVSGIGSTNNSAFTIVNGQLRTAAILDFETQGSFSIRVRATDQGGLFIEKPFTIAVFNVNEPPSISSIADQSISEDGSTGSLPFLIDDPESFAGSLTLSATSSNVGLIPNANIVLTGTGADRSLVATPALNQNGTATISIIVSDGTFSSTQTFQVTVTAMDDPVVIALNHQPMVFRVSGRKVVAIDSTATVSDADTTTLMFGGAVLQVSGQSAKDKLSILKQDGISRKGKNVLLGKTIIGTIAGGTKSAPLTIHLNAAATQSSVQSLLRSVGFRAVDKLPGSRELHVQITNIGGANTNSATRSIQVIP